MGKIAHIFHKWEAYYLIMHKKSNNHHTVQKPRNYKRQHKVHEDKELIFII